MSIVGVITMIFVWPSPPNPPSISAFNRLSMVGEAPLKTQLKWLFTSRDFIFLLLTYALIYSVYSSMGAIVGLLINKFNYLAWTASAGGACFIIFGIIGILVHGFIADKYKKYWFQLILINLCSLASMVFCLFFFGKGVFLACLACTLIGLNMIPITSHGPTCVGLVADDL